MKYYFMQKYALKSTLLRKRQAKMQDFNANYSFLDEQMQDVPANPV